MSAENLMSGTDTDSNFFPSCNLLAPNVLTEGERNVNNEGKEEEDLHNSCHVLGHEPSNDQQKMDGNDIKTNNVLGSFGGQEKDASKSQYGQSVIIVQNPNDLNLESLDPTLLKCVKKVLADSDGQHSYMIVNKGDNGDSCSEELTTYVIDLNTLGKQTATSSSQEECEKSGSSTKHSSSLPSLPKSEAHSSSYAAFDSSQLPSNPLSLKKEREDLQGSSSSTPGALDYQEQVEISFVSCPSQPDLSCPMGEPEVSIESVCPQTQTVYMSTAPPAETDDFSCISVKDIPKHLPGASQSRTHSSLLSSFKPNPPDKLPNVDISHSSTLPSTSSTSGTVDTYVNKNSPSESPKSQVADCLLHIAKKMINQSRKLTVDLPDNQNVASPAVEITEERSGSESVITMYLSSPNELKDKIEKLKTDSPVILMQAGDDLLVDEKFSRQTSVISKDRPESNDFITSNLPGSNDTDSTSSLDHKCDNADSIATTLSTTGVVYRCLECGYSSHNKHYYKQHVDLVHNEDRPYKCPHCDYAGKRRHALLEHMVVHSNQRPFTCDHCNASFRKKGHLTNHVKLHTSQRLVHCGVCKIQLPDTEAFEAHLHKIHKTDKLYKCKLCEHTVVDRDAMLKHLQEHNQTVVFSCSKCPSMFDDEDSLVSHMKTVHESVLLNASFVKQDQKNNTLDGGEVASQTKSQPTNIMCSECGFVCSNPEMMQKHMWVHINKDDKQSVEGHDKIKINPPSKEEASSTLGVLKMNVDMGQKTLPENVVYQCSSCNFTSSDNSVFIKHMLAHKTQEKRQRSATKELPKGAEEQIHLEEKPTNPSFQPRPIPVSYYADVPGKVQGQDRGDTSVPFVYDKSAARFRCTICGYHCEFQRTIKAHIWKHSGHQNIEYPTFDQSGNNKKPNLTPPVVQVMASKGIPKSSEQGTVSRESNVVSSTSGSSTQQHLPVLKTRSGEVVQLVPVNPLKTKYNPRDIIQIKDNSIIVPAEYGKGSAASRLLESIAFSEASTESKDVNVSGSDLLGAPSSSSQPVVITASGSMDELQEFVLFSDNDNSATLQTSAITVTNQNQIPQTYTVSAASHPVMTEQETVSTLEDEEGCTEPSVVVEVVDSIPSGFGLTGMKSQQGSPRVVGLDGSGSEAKLSKALEAARDGNRRNSSDSEASLSESDKNAEKELFIKSLDAAKNHHSYSARLRCPMCDCLLTEDFKSHLLSCQRKAAADKPSRPETRASKQAAMALVSASYDYDDAENLPTEDTDSTESSDELTLSGDFSGSSSQQKSGICSSLLAVIEQLRERSRSESEDDKQASQISKKGGKKKLRQGENLDAESLDDLKNIEKITESGSDKYRCSLCHYTSQRICNIKLHMKTHRQKKPSECSLCDFSSSSSEALQDHMLKHCKVRTYACKFCPQNFNHKSTLRAHLRAHKDQEPFLCAYCVYETTNPIDYREHMQVHSGCSSRLRCPGCDLILSNKDDLTAHLLKCKGSTQKIRSPVSSVEEKPAVVKEKETEKPEEQSSDVGSVHHACVVGGCSFSSPNLKELQDHLSVHCNPSLLVCNLCDFKALHSRSLKSHMKRHANDQRYVQQPLEQYKCNLCGYVCHHLPSLKSHMWRHASDQSYSYEFTNDVINAAIDHDTRVDADGEADDPELLDRVINSERKILEGELTKCSKGDGQRPICWVTFRCCSCGFETINKAKLNIHMRTHADIIQQALDIPRKSGSLQGKPLVSQLPQSKLAMKRLNLSDDTHSNIPAKVLKTEDSVE